MLLGGIVDQDIDGAKSLHHTAYHISAEAHLCITQKSHMDGKPAAPL